MKSQNETKIRIKELENEKLLIHLNLVSHFRDAISLDLVDAGDDILIKYLSYSENVIGLCDYNEIRDCYKEAEYYRHPSFECLQYNNESYYLIDNDSLVDEYDYIEVKEIVSELDFINKEIETRKEYID